MRLEVKGVSTSMMRAAMQTSPSQKVDEATSFASAHNGNEQKETETVSKPTLEKQLDSMNELLEHNNTSIRFNLHEDLGRFFVQIVDLNTDEVMKEFPPEKFLDMVASMLRNVGLLIDKKI